MKRGIYRDPIPAEKPEGPPADALGYGWPAFPAKDNAHGPKNARLTAWAWLSVWGGDFEALTSAAEEFLYV